MRILNTTMFSIVCLMFILACDPALRMEFVNETRQPIKFILSSENCELMYDNLNKADSLVVLVSLDTGYNNKYVEFLGIGGWNEEDIAVMEECLESMSDSIKFEGIDYEINLSEFGNSLMHISFKDK